MAIFPINLDRELLCRLLSVGYHISVFYVMSFNRGTNVHFSEVFLFWFYMLVIDNLL